MKIRIGSKDRILADRDRNPNLKDLLVITIDEVDVVVNALIVPGTV